MEIILSKSEAEEIFFNSLCNGLSEITSYGLDFVYDSKEYELAKYHLITEGGEHNRICFEDVIIEILREGGKLTLIDSESDDKWTIGLEDVHERVKTTPIEHLIDAISENDDASTADAILQTVFFKEIVYA